MAMLHPRAAQPEPGHRPGAGPSLERARSASAPLYALVNTRRAAYDVMRLTVERGFGEMWRVIDLDVDTTIPGRDHRESFVATGFASKAEAEAFARTLENDPERRKALDELEAGWRRIYLDLNARAEQKK